MNTETTQTASEEIRAKYVDRVRKLLAKAESTTSPEEAETFFAKAHQLMAQWQIEQIELRDTSDKVIRHEIRLSSSMPTADVQCIAAIARQFRLEPLYRQYAPGCPAAAILFGFESDLDQFLMFWASVELQMVGAMKAQEPRGADKNRLRTFRQSFKIGFSSRVAARLREQREATEQKAEKASPGVGLVLVSRRDEVRAAADSASSGRQSRGSLQVNGSAYAAGHRAANTADLGGSRVGSGSRKAIGR